jgi:quercetin dioxygenase-like cupin family protein
MPPLKSFIVFGERIDVLINAAMSNGASATIVQHVPAGGGPPPHSHAKEDETFTVLEGDFEVFRDGQWHPLAKGEVAYGPRGGVHTFRNEISERYTFYP